MINARMKQLLDQQVREDEAGSPKLAGCVPFEAGGMFFLGGGGVTYFRRGMFVFVRRRRYQKLLWGFYGSSVDSLQTILGRARKCACLVNNNERVC